MKEQLSEGPRSEEFGLITYQLQEADSVLRKEKAMCVLLRSWSWLCGFVLLGFSVDVALHLSSSGRFRWDVVFGFLFVGIVGRAAFYAWHRRIRGEHVARILERRDQALGSKLINFLQLRSQAEDARLAPLTRDLARQAVHGYAAELQNFDLVKLARTHQVRTEGLRAILGVLGFIVLLACGHEMSRIEAARFLDPFGDHPPYSLTRLNIVHPDSDGAQVLYGQNLLVDVSVSGHRPGELYLSFYPPGRPDQTTTLPMFDKAEQGFSQQLEAINSDLVVFAHTKNRHGLSKQRRVSVVLTPQLEAASVRIFPPSYTGRPTLEKSLEMKAVKVLAGSRLEFHLRSNRPLTGGNIEVIKSVDETDSVAMNNTAEREVSGSLDAHENARLRFSVTDVAGHASRDTWEVALGVAHDLPPSVQIANPAADSYVAIDYRVEVVVEANDDYGLQSVRIHQALNDRWDEPRIFRYNKGVLNARKGFPLDFSQMHISPGDTLSLFAEAIDTAPEPHIARSKLVTLTVIGADDYNAFLRQRIDMADVQSKYADLFRQLHDFAEIQAKLGEQSDLIQKDLQSAKTEQARELVQQKLDHLLAQQRKLNAELNKLAETMESFVRKEPLFDVESELQQALDQQAKKIRASTASNESASSKIAETLSPGTGLGGPGGGTGAGNFDPQMLADFKAASQDQLGQLGEAQTQAEEEVLKPLAEMSLMHEIIKDLNRFKELYAAQAELAEQTKAYDRQGPLSREDQLALKDLAGTQKAIGEELESVEEKLWEDGKVAQETFPKAGKSAQDLAEKIGDARLRMHAEKASEAMLAGNGAKGSQLAGHLRDEMDKLFSQCDGTLGEMASELDQQVGLNRELNMRRSFQQMLQNRKFGTGNQPGFGQGANAIGLGGTAVLFGPNANVLGNEAAISHGAKGPRGRSEVEHAEGRIEVFGDSTDGALNRNPINRESDAVQGETPIDQYRELVDKYFKALTQ